ncbi:MAG: hypothetical protein KAU50_02010 [Candidatus Marinimicrobia bacterium]|nr:hypothetical protein [Candidatus Neomarinimicrobiota bacterium]
MAWSWRKSKKASPPKKVEIKPVLEQQQVRPADYMTKPSPEIQAKLADRDKVSQEVKEFVEGHPEEASMLLKAWLTGAFKAKLPESGKQ